MSATVIAERIGWRYSMTTLKDRVRQVRPEYLGVDPVDRVSYQLFSAVAAARGCEAQPRHTQTPGGCPLACARVTGHNASEPSGTGLGSIGPHDHRAR